MKDFWRYSKGFKEVTKSPEGVISSIDSICAINSFCKSEEEVHKTGLLISAAPEMLSALENSLQMLEQTLAHRNSAGLKIGNVFLEVTITQVKDAIKKATE